ncbi:hypothetical protein BH11PLA2_BH11PLA2_00570 [soil metagenome]
MLRGLAATILLLTVSPLLFAQGLSAEQLDRIKKATVYIIVTDTRGGTGSGFVVKHDGNDLYIVTNNHVIDHDYEKIMQGRMEPAKESKAKVKVVFDSGTPTERSAKGIILAADPDRDLAVVKVTGLKDSPKPLDVSDSPMLMETLAVLACGFPFGGQLADGNKNPNVTLTPCTVSSLHKDSAGNLKTVQVAGNLNPGNSGGPLVTNDGKLIGVAVRSILGSGIGEAVPYHEVHKLLKGRPGRVKLTPVMEEGKEGTAKLTVTLLDPYNKIKSVTAHTNKTVAKIPAPKEGDSPPLMPGAMKVEMKIEDGEAVCDVAIADGKAAIQLELVNDDGTIITNPIEIKVSTPRAVPGGAATPDPDNELIPGGGKPRFRGRDGRVYELPAMPAVVRPKASEKAVDLSDLNSKAESFLDKSVTVEGLSNCQLMTNDPNAYEITVVTDANQAPRNLRMILPRDLAMQLSELALPDAFDVNFALRIEGKVLKPKGRNSGHIVEVSELSFLDAEAKVVTTIKPLSRATGSKATLSAVNRFPADYKGQKVTLEGMILGSSNIGREYGLRINHSTGMTVLGLKFFTSKDLSERVETDVPREGAMARFECNVENVDPKDGMGILGVSSIELLDKDGKPGKKLSGDGKILYPVMATLKPAPEKTAATTSTEAKPESRKAAAAAEPKGDGNMLLYLGVGGGVGLLALLTGGYFMLTRKKISTPKKAKYGGKAVEEVEDTPKPRAKAKPAYKSKPAVKEEAEVEEEAEASPPVTQAAPRPLPKPPSKPARPAPKTEDNPFANFG